MPERDTILAVLQSEIAIAGLVLVFAGFLLSRAGEYQTIRGDKYKWLATAGMIPVIAALVSAWFCVDSIEGNQWHASYSLLGLKILLALTGAYAVISAFVAFFP